MSAGAVQKNGTGASDARVRSRHIPRHRDGAAVDRTRTSDSQVPIHIHGAGDGEIGCALVDGDGVERSGVDVDRLRVAVKIDAP